MWPFRGSNQEDLSNDSSTSSAESSAAQTARQGRQTRRDEIRSISEDNLQPPTGPRGLRIQRSNSPQSLIRSLAASRSPTPSPNTATTTVFDFPATAPTRAMDPEQLQAIITAAVTAATAGQAAANRAIVEAAVNAAAANHVSSQQSMRRPALPPFDPKDIDNWVRRVEAAFDRLSITSPKVKLSNLDEKLSTSGDASINDFLCSPPTQANYDGLIAYLKDKHGRTKSQKAASLIEGTEREGRTPSQLLATMKEKAGNINLDDIFKEQLLRRLPADVKMHLVNMDDKTAKDVAAAADAFFDKEGKPKNKSSVSGINAVGTPRQQQSAMRQQQPTRTASPQPQTYEYSMPFDDDDGAEINAVRFKHGQRQRVQVNNQGGARSQSRGRNFNSNNSGRSQSRGRQYNSNNNDRYGKPSSGSSSSSTPYDKNSKVCFYHHKFGKEARSCNEPCIMHSTFKSGNAKASH